MIAKILMALSMAVSAVLGGAGPHAPDGVSAVGSFYLHADEHGVPTLWSETNGVPGLQVDVGLGEDGALFAPDTRLTV